ncbi:ATP-binding domain-containing protein [Mesorhizobium robiniae]|uniref:ATP-binding domain-containing protein n=1 Tax=Mesorhizobium TaxID=68287 RepID=UPI0033980038
MSTIHKSKGLECANTLIMMCDRSAFSGTEYKRRLLYVGLSRAKETLTLVVSQNNATPLFNALG